MATKGTDKHVSAATLGLAFASLSPPLVPAQGGRPACHRIYLIAHVCVWGVGVHKSDRQTRSTLLKHAKKTLCSVNNS